MKIINAEDTSTSVAGEKLAPGPALDFIRAIARHMAWRDHQQDLARKSSIDLKTMMG